MSLTIDLIFELTMTNFDYFQTFNEYDVINNDVTAITTTSRAISSNSFTILQFRFTKL